LTRGLTKRAKDIKELKVERPPRATVSEREALKRMKAFSKRKEKFVATVRAGKG
jgi:hypothetical protein